MREFVVTRIGYTIVTLFLIATLLFFLFRLLPGDPMIAVISPGVDAAEVQHLHHIFGLDLPMWQQYLIFLKDLVTLNFGRSFSSGQEVAGIIGYRLVNTLLLMSAGMTLALLLGVVLGTIMAWRRGGILDVAGTVLGLVFQAAPPFITGLVLLIVFSYRLGWFPTGGMFAPGTRPPQALDLLLDLDFYRRLALPTITLTAYYVVTPMLIMRDGMLEVMGSDYVEFAKAKGLSPARVVIHHAARNALMGVVTIASILIGFAIGGQVIVETLFSWPGMGQLMVDAASQHDYPVALASFLVLAVVVVVLNLLTDLLYGWLDPRIKSAK
jgi:peptide/nickel transport system permease protein